MLTSEAASRLNVSRRTIQRVAARHGIGSRVGPVLVLSESDVRRLDKLVQRRRGWPAGNQLWRKRKQETVDG